MKERLQKLLAQANIASRRASEDYITRGRVRVNGEIAHLGDKADPATDEITVDGTPLKFDPQKRVYIAFNKPKQVLSTDKPHRGDQRETVMGMIGLDEHLFSIGRLDADSEGLMVMTNDGALAQRLSHPRYRHTKTYRVEVVGLPTADTIDKWQTGVTLEDGTTAPCFVEIAKGSLKITTLRIVMTEGKKRQIRRVASLLGHPVKRLVRTHIGMLPLGELEPGKWRELTPKEVMALSTPSPEIKTLRAQKPRSASDKADDQRTPRRHSTPPDRRADAADEKPARRRRITPRSESKLDDQRDEKPTSRRRIASGGKMKSDAAPDSQRPARKRKITPRSELKLDDQRDDQPARKRRRAPGDQPPADAAPDTQRPARKRKITPHGKPAAGKRDDRRRDPRDKKPRSRKDRPR